MTDEDIGKGGVSLRVRAWNSLARFFIDEDPHVMLDALKAYPGRVTRALYDAVYVACAATATGMFLVCLLLMALLPDGTTRDIAYFAGGCGSLTLFAIALTSLQVGMWQEGRRLAAASWCTLTWIVNVLLCLLLITHR